jgi:predicted transcriptional regulator
MKRKPSAVPAERDLDVLDALWGLARPATVAEVRGILARNGHRLAYTTVQTLLNRLCEKRMAARDDLERTHRYRPLLQRSQVAGAALRNLTKRFFQGSPTSLAMHLVQSDLDPRALAQLSGLIDARDAELKRGRKKS